MIDVNMEKKLMDLAVAASLASYSPYSNFRVGAAILCEDGKIFTGTNIENASYGAAICAERTAAVKAISEGQRVFKAVAVFGSPKEASDDELQYAYPCGICRQFLCEFAADDMVLLVGVSSEDYKKYNFFKELLPNSFGPKDLQMDLAE